MIGIQDGRCVEWFQFALQIDHSFSSIGTVGKGIPPSDFKPYYLCRKDSDSPFYVIHPGV